jgi:uncharacterized protein (TIGR00730 family)
MRHIRSVCVYCGSSALADEVYKASARDLGKILAQEGIQLVYGGGMRGLMGIVADGTLDNGGTAKGYITKHLDNIEGGHKGLNELHVVDSMHARKLKMSEDADAFVILPGGFGTLDEFFEILTWKQLDMHDKPIILVNVNGYWDPLVLLVKNVINQKFADQADINLFYVVNDLSEVLAALHRAPEPHLGFASQLL